MYYVLRIKKGGSHMHHHALMVHLYNAMKAGYHCWAEYLGKYHRYDFYCNKGRS